jgi:excisionase family DNA binding protein
MELFEEVKRPTKSEQKMAMASYNALNSVIEQLTSEKTEIEIEETNEKIVIPSKALKMLGLILKAMSQGKTVSIVPMAAEVTTQKAAEILGCSRPHFIKLLEEGKISYSKIGKHRRIKFEDVLKYKNQMKQDQKNLLIEIMNNDEDLGLYDS